MNMHMNNNIVNGVDLSTLLPVIYRPELNRELGCFEKPVLVHFWSDEDQSWVIYWGKKGDNPIWEFPLSDSLRRQVYGDEFPYGY
jgi:hypothetical protein